MYNQLRIVYVISLASIINSVIWFIDNFVSVLISFKTFSPNATALDGVLHTCKTLIPSILIILVLSSIVIVCKKYYKLSKKELTLKYNLFFVGAYLIISNLSFIFYMPSRISALIITVKLPVDKVFISQLTSLILPIVVWIVIIILAILMIRKGNHQNKEISIKEVHE